LRVAEHPDRGRVAALIESISTRAVADTEHLAARMFGHCWPGGMGDRTEVIALEWVARWRPQRQGVPGHECNCASGYCAVCN